MINGEGEMTYVDESRYNGQWMNGLVCSWQQEESVFIYSLLLSLFSFFLPCIFLPLPIFSLPLPSFVSPIFLSFLPSSLSLSLPPSLSHSTMVKVSWSTTKALPWCPPSMETGGMGYVMGRGRWSCLMGLSIVVSGRTTNLMGRGIIPFPRQTIITLVRGSSLMWSCAITCRSCDCHVMMLLCWSCVMWESCVTSRVVWCSHVLHYMIVVM